MTIPADIEKKARDVVTAWKADVYNGRAELNAAIARAIMEERERDRWQPIETAPKDGTFVLVWNGNKLHCARYDSIESEWVSSFKTVTKRLAILPVPTHWMHLQATPIASAIRNEGEHG
ncbi:MAG: hypothetical protein LCH86_09725 [Proteobacteria bacterium]|nr:hypothetical protein [Pseudomonadota bacterium]